MYSNANQHHVESTDVFMAYASSTSSRNSDSEDKEWGVVFALESQVVGRVVGRCVGRCVGSPFFVEVSCPIYGNPCCIWIGWNSC